MRATGITAGLLACGTLALAACAARTAGNGGDLRPPSETVTEAGAGPAAAPGGVVRTGVSTGTLAGQYSHPRPAGTSATGASAWVGPPPEPAYVATGPLPPAAPPPPPPAAVANRQPSAPEAPASDIVRPEAAASQASPAEAPPAEAPASVDLARGRALFNQWSCGTCHLLADADGSGAVGPSLDGNDRLSEEIIVRIVTNGQGAMPAFGGQISEEDIAALAAYILAAKK